MIQTFNFKQDLNANQQSSEFNVQTTALGDGYEQNVSIGIHQRKSTWQYQRTAKKAEILQIKAFFDEHKGVKSFLWRSPLDDMVHVRVGEYQLSCQGGDIWQISTTFNQVFSP